MVRGLELLFNLIRGEVRSKFDLAVAAVHCLLTNEGLQCRGIGDTFSKDDTPSELLPPRWNDNQDVYTLRYIGKSPAGKYLLKAVRTGKLLLNVSVVYEENAAASVAINVNKMVGDDYGDYAAAYLDLPALVKDFRSEILEKLFIEPATKSKSKSERPDKMPAQPSAPSSLDQGPNPRLEQGSPREGQPAFPRVGGLPLHPLGPGHGDMFYDPIRQSNPRDPRTFDPFGGPGGSVPPGSRFDPMGPPMRGPYRPTPDHFRPPDFNDFY